MTAKDARVDTILRAIASGHTRASSVATATGLPMRSVHASLVGLCRGSAPPVACIGQGLAGRASVSRGLVNVYGLTAAGRARVAPKLPGVPS